MSKENWKIIIVSSIAGATVAQLLKSLIVFLVGVIG